MGRIVGVLIVFPIILLAPPVDAWAAEKVTVDNFVRAETDMTLSDMRALADSVRCFTYVSQLLWINRMSFV